MTFGPAGPHGRHRRLRPDEQGEDIGLQHDPPVLRIGLLEDGLGMAQPGVVDHDVEPAGRLGGPADEALHLVHLPHVHHHGLTAPAGGGEAGHRGGHRLRGAATEDHVGPG